MSELPTQKAIVQRLNAMGHRAWLNEVALMFTGYRFRRPANARTADVIGCLKGGRMLAIEVKKEAYRERVTRMWVQTQRSDYRGRLSFKLDNAKDTRRCLDQADNLKWLQEAGALAFFCFSLEDVQVELELQEGR